MGNPVIDRVATADGKNVGPFKTIPTHEQLRSMQRDLRFFPSTSQEPTSITQAQLESFNRCGYLAGIRILDDESITRHRSLFDGHLAAALAAGQSSFSLSSAHMRFPDVYDLMHHPTILGCVADIIGPEIIGIAAQYFCKLPADETTVAWHQDASYWPLTPSQTVTVWLAIDDVDIDNACMRFVSGSHLHGPIGFRASEAAERNVLDQTVDDVERYGPLVDVELLAGEASIHSDLLLHSSHENNSDRRRCGLTLRYCTPDVRALPDFGCEREGVLISGTDVDGHWGNPSRPTTTFLPPTAASEKVGEQ